MSDRKQWLENAILDYISKVRSRGLLDITSHMKLSVDTTMESLYELVKQGLVIKEPRGISDVYIAATYKGVEEGDTVKIRYLLKYQFGSCKSKAYLSRQGYTFEASFGSYGNKDRVIDHSGTFELDELEKVNK